MVWFIYLYFGWEGCILKIKRSVKQKVLELSVFPISSIPDFLSSNSTANVEFNVRGRTKSALSSRFWFL